MFEVQDGQAVTIKPFKGVDPETGDYIAVSGSAEYTTLTINQRTYYFHPETGEIDGDSTQIERDRPILVTSSE